MWSIIICGSFGMRKNSYVVESVPKVYSKEVGAREDLNLAQEFFATGLRNMTNALFSFFVAQKPKKVMAEEKFIHFSRKLFVHLIFFCITRRNMSIFVFLNHDAKNAYAKFKTSRVPTSFGCTLYS